MIYINYYEIGERIRKYRKAYGLSQEQLAEKVGVSVTHISHIETGNTKLSLTCLVNIANTLGESVDTLLFGIGHVSKNMLIEDLSIILEDSSIEETIFIKEIITAIKISLRKNLS